MNFLPFLKEIAVFLLMAGLVASPTSAAPPQGKDKPEKTHKHFHDKRHAPDMQSAEPLVSVALGFKEARRLAVAKGCTGYHALPPGIRKNLARGKPLPPGIAKKVGACPVLRQLPTYAGYEWRIYGSDLVLVAVATAIVAEVLFDVFE